MRSTMMKNIFLRFCYLTLIYLAFFSPPASAEFLPGAALHRPNVGVRSLLQNLKSCPISFEFRNYTIITSQCKGPNYSQELCCNAFKEFACPVAQYINDLTTDCSSTMFSYINLYGKYPPALFSSLCQGDKYGLACDVEVPSPSASENANASGKSQVLQSFSVFIWLVLFNLLGNLILTSWNCWPIFVSHIGSFVPSGNSWYHFYWLAIILYLICLSRSTAFQFLVFIYIEKWNDSRALLLFSLHLWS